MMNGTLLVNILVLHAALQALDWSPPGSGDYLVRFQKHRSVLEGIANGKHVRGLIEENGTIVIQKGDR
jgi:hypothetical protein